MKFGEKKTWKGLIEKWPRVCKLLYLAELFPQVNVMEPSLKMTVRSIKGLLVRWMQTSSLVCMGSRRQFLQVSFLLLLMSPTLLQAEMQSDERKVQYASFDGKSIGYSLKGKNGNSLKVFFKNLSQ